MHDGIYYMMLYKYKYKNTVNIDNRYNSNIKINKSCIKNKNSICKNKHVRFKGEWCTFFRFLYN